MPKTLDSRALALAALLAVPAFSACGGPSPGDSHPNAFTALTSLTHRPFPIAAGVHAVDCAACHGTFASFKQFDCLGCHVRPPTEAVHTTTTGYVYDNPSCLNCHRDPTTTPFDHKGIATCSSCHASGQFYAALPVPGVTHLAIPVIPGTSNLQDCSACHRLPSNWFEAVGPLVTVDDPAASVAVNALVPRYSGTSIVGLTPQVELLPMGMSHTTTAVNMAGLPCSACHADASVAIYFPGSLHSSLAILAQPTPLTCGDCHAGSVPTGFVGPFATSPARTPPSGEMKHDAVAWSASAPTASRVVTADCGTCHLSPTESLAATWATGKGGTSPARFHASLTAAGLAQPTSCLDCHANSRPIDVLTSAAAALPAGLIVDHVGAGASGDCAACHAGSVTAWSGGRAHLAGSATPASCLPCHAGQRPTSAAGWTSTSYAASPFDYGTNSAGITHGDGQDCATCHTGPGAGGAWGGTQTFVGGRFTHGPGTVARSTCIACHMSQRPDLVVGTAQAAAALGGFDHALNGPGDCIGCHQATVAAGSYVKYYGPGGVLPGGDWKGGKGYPGNTLVSAPGQFVTVNELSLARVPVGGLVTAMTSTQETLYNAMLHSSAQIPAQLAPGTSLSGDPASCWHCHTHNAAGTVTTLANGLFHPSIASYSATVGGPVTPLPQPNAGCTDCHDQMRPNGVVELAGSALRPMDHAALFTGTVTIGGQVVSGVAGLDCSTCHAVPGTNWRDGVFHTRIGAAVPADCVACHYPLMVDRARADVASGTRYTMSHGSQQLTSQACASCHTAALAGSTATPYQSTAWKTGAYHASVSPQPTGCLDCHAVSEPAPGRSTQSSSAYALAPATAVTSSNARQWMNHGAAPVVGVDCVTCHAADARSSGAAWSASTLFHPAVAKPGTCQACHGLSNGGGTVAGTNNNLPLGLTSSTTLTSASANALTGVPAGTRDQITHSDASVTSHDCAFCHTQAGRSTVAGIQGVEWAQARFHASFSAAAPLMINGTTARCSSCHLNVKPGAAYPAQDHAAFTGAQTSQDCSACHSWPGTGSATAAGSPPNWRGASNFPPFITVGGFAIPLPPATVATTQPGIANLPHPTLGTGTTCATCHTGGIGGKQAKGYDHASALINSACASCHEAGSNLVGTVWNRATAQASGSGNTRPFTLTGIVAHKGGAGGGSCNLTVSKHFYPVKCGECHAAPTGIATATTGTAYTNAWYFPHTKSRMTDPATCNLCHVGQGCSK